MMLCTTKFSHRGSELLVRVAIDLHHALGLAVRRCAGRQDALTEPGGNNDYRSGLAVIHLLACPGLVAGHSDCQQILDLLQIGIGSDIRCAGVEELHHLCAELSRVMVDHQYRDVLQTAVVRAAAQAAEGKGNGQRQQQRCGDVDHQTGAVAEHVFDIFPGNIQYLLHGINLMV